MQYRPEVDGLRALAVVPVILFHAQVPGFPGGFVGVDIFFVISGYLITSILYHELASGRFSLGAFYERRIRRLLPALFVVLAATTAMTLAWLPPDAADDYFKSLIAVPVFGSNLYFAETTGYFSTSADLKPLLHTWSLAVEEQYYLFFPLLMLAAWRVMPGKIIHLVSLGFLLSLGFTIVYGGADPGRAFYSMPARCWELMVGALAALWLARKSTCVEVGWRHHAASLAGLALILAVVTVGADLLVPHVFALLPTLGAVLVILAARPGTLAYALLSHRLPVGIGLISYSLYLWHQPLMAMTRYRSGGRHDLELMLTAVAATLVLAYLTWRYVETPFRNRERYPAKGLVTAAIAGSIAFLGVGLLGLSVDYASLRYGEAKARQARAIHATLNPKIYCAQPYKDVTAKGCVLGSPQGSRTLAVIGDSHASQWTDALDVFGKQHRVRVIMYAKSACASADVNYHYPALKREYRECAEWRGNVVEQLAQTRADAILVTNSSAGYAGPTRLVEREVWKKGVRSFVEQLQAHAGRIIWLADNPRYTADPLLCFEANFWRDQNQHCSAPRAEVVDEALLALEREALSALPLVTVADFLDFYCDSERCTAADAEGPIMRDTNHLTARATAALQPRLNRLLSEALRASNQRTSSSSTSKIRLAFGGIGPAPLAP